MINVPLTKEEIAQLRDLSINHPHHYVRRKALAISLKSQGKASTFL